jgi:oligopeptidase B
VNDASPPRRNRSAQAKKKPHKVLFGAVPGENRGSNPMSPPIERDDDLFWLRDDNRKDPEVLKHLEAENAYAEKHLEHVSPLVETLYAEIKNSIKESDDDAPFAWGPEHEYFVRTVEGSAYPVILRLNRTVNAKNPEVVLDVNEVAKPLKYCSIGAFKPSPCHTLLAYSVDSSGYETYETRFPRSKHGRAVAGCPS